MGNVVVSGHVRRRSEWKCIPAEVLLQAGRLAASGLNYRQVSMHVFSDERGRQGRISYWSVAKAHQFYINSLTAEAKRLKRREEELERPLVAVRLTPGSMERVARLRGFGRSFGSLHNVRLLCEDGVARCFEGRQLEVLAAGGEVLARAGKSKGRVAAPEDGHRGRKGHKVEI